MMNARVILIVLAVLALSCGKEKIVISSEADDFLSELLTIMENNSINRNTIDWDEFKKTVYEAAGSARNIEETYDAIRVALTLLGDNHSFFLKPDGGGIVGMSDIRCGFDRPNQPSIPEHIGYISIRISSGSDRDEMKEYAEGIQNAIKSEDSENIVGWIVDLRGSGGGNMWPALAGIGPILGEGTAGHFIDPNDRSSSWGYSDGASVSNLSSVVKVSNPYQLINQNPKVALLLDDGVASSGEAIAISFIGREQTKSFGSPTCGLSTANRGFDLSNNSTLFLTVSYMADRNRNIYGGQVLPDENSNIEMIIQQAIDYLEN